MAEGSSGVAGIVFVRGISASHVPDYDRRPNDGVGEHCRRSKALLDRRGASSSILGLSGSRVATPSAELTE
jgi:hypothetical protein